MLSHYTFIVLKDSASNASPFPEAYGSVVTSRGEHNWPAYKVRVHLII